MTGNIDSRATRTVLAAVLVVLLGGCATGRAADTSSPPVSLSGESVLVLPLRAAGIAPAAAREVDAELLAALEEREPGAGWIPPARVEALVAQAPGLLDDPYRRPPLSLSRNGRWVEGGSARTLTLYGALADAEIALVPERLATDEAGTARRLEAYLIDVRAGAVLWRGAGTGSDGAEAARDLARKLLGMDRR